MKNVLVVDDDWGILDTIRLYLSGIANVTTASNGRQTLSLVCEKHYDVILLDIEMPIMNGFLVLDQLRNQKESINIPVIMLTGRRDKSYVMNSIAMGIDGYILKPVVKSVLIKKIEEVCQKRTHTNVLKTVLAIDDDMAYLKQINSFLKDRYNVIMINSARLALDYLSNNIPDVILLDYHMPLYNGVAMMSIIRQNVNCKDIPIIILSGTLNHRTLGEIYPHEPAAYLVKPVKKDVLIDNIEKVLA